MGTEPECRSVLKDPYETFALRGTALLPGFIDTHLHPPAMILFELSADLAGVRSLEELQSRLRAMAEKDTSANWILGLQFDEEALAPPRLPDRHDLDWACPDRPALLLKRDGHTVIANSAALEAAGITAATPDPPGGRIVREPDGRPNGIFRETAAQILLDAMPLPEIQTLVDAAGSVFARLASHGITSAGTILQTDEEGISGSKGVFDIPRMELVHDAIPVSLYALVVCTQPIFIHSEKGWLEKRLGPDRARWVYPFRAPRDAGIRLAGASDAPVESLDVLHAIQCCVTREGFQPHQALTVDEAIAMFTIEAAFAQFEEGVTGSITPGKRADLVVLDRHPGSVSPESIGNIRVQRTVFAGRVIHEAPR